MTAATGGRPRKLIQPTGREGEYQFGRPVWSPTGRWIAYSSLNRGWQKHEVRSIWVVTPSGRGKRRLTSGHRDTPLDWSPQGDRILFYRDDVVRRQVRPGALLIIDVRSRKIVSVPGTAGQGITGASWRR